MTYFYRRLINNDLKTDPGVNLVLCNTCLHQIITLIISNHRWGFASDHMTGHLCPSVIDWCTCVIYPASKWSIHFTDWIAMLYSIICNRHKILFLNVVWWSSLYPRQSIQINMQTLPPLHIWIEYSPKKSLLRFKKRYGII